jgi:hypothetical protein
MKRARGRVAAAVVAAVSLMGVGALAQARAPDKAVPVLLPWHHGGVGLQYLSTWEKLREQDHQQAHIVTLKRDTPVGPVLVALAVTRNPPPVDDRFKTRPGMAAFGFGYPLAKKVAGSPKGDGATASFGEMALKDGPAPAARIVVPAPGSDGKLVMVDAGVQISDGVMLAAAVVTHGKVDDLTDDVAFHAAVREAYAILRTFGVDKK